MHYQPYKNAPVNALLILKSIFVISPLSSLLLFTSVYLDLCG